ncbi:MAG: tetratricopeptide repeat protein [Myxococcota bacterium]
MSRLPAAACVVTLVLCAAVAEAHPDVDAAKDAYLNGDFPAALNRLDEAERSPTATEEDRVAIHWYRAASHHAQGNTDEAAAALDRLLELRPLFQPDRDEAPPNLRALFQRRLTAYQEAHGVGVQQPAWDGARLVIPLTGHVEEASHVMIFARPPDTTDYVAFQLPVTGTHATGLLPDETLWHGVREAGAMDLVVEVQNARGVPLARAGNALVPLQLPVTPEQADIVLATVAPAPPPATPPPGTEAANPAPPPTAQGEKSSGLPVTPWMGMAGCTGASTACLGLTTFLGATFFSGILLSEALLPNGFGGNIQGFLAILSFSMCPVATVACVNSGLLSACTFTLFLSELYYVRGLAVPPPAVPLPRQPTEADEDADLVDEASLQRTRTQAY